MIIRILPKRTVNLNAGGPESFVEAEGIDVHINALSEGERCDALGAPT